MLMVRMNIVRRIRRIVAGKKVIAIVLGVALLVIVAGTGMLLYTRNDMNEKSESKIGAIPDKDIPAILDAYASEGKVDEGMRYIDAQIDKQADQQDKRDYLVYKSQFANKVGRTEVALESAKAASDIEPDLTTDLALAEAYEKSSNKQEAAKYYQQVADSIEDDTFMSRYRHIWEEKARELSS